MVTPELASAGQGPARHHGVPAGLHVVERAPTVGWDRYEGPVIVLVHGALDRAASFSRVAVRLRGLAVVAYDRRGYQGSRAAGVAAGLGAHADDLVAIAAAYDTTGRHVTAVGHSIGGTIVLAAAVERPDAFASVGAYEPSMPWLGFHRTEPDAPPDLPIGLGADEGPGRAAEGFFRRMTGTATWARLSAAQQAERRADGPALVADLASLRAETPFDVTRLRVPGVVCAGGPSSFAHHRHTADWLAAHVPSIERLTVAEAGHGAHLSHPDAFARLVRHAGALGAATRPSVEGAR